jgi:hypothetical protein
MSRQVAAVVYRHIVALMTTTEAKGAEKAQNRGAFLENLFEELRRKVSVEK